MNKQIQELARRADQYVKSNPKAGVTIHAGDMFNEKFAELIIRETLKVTGATPSMTETAKKHFGVEEK